MLTTPIHQSILNILTINHQVATMFHFSLGKWFFLKLDRSKLKNDALLSRIFENENSKFFFKKEKFVEIVKIFRSSEKSVEIAFKKEVFIMF